MFGRAALLNQGGNRITIDSATPVSEWNLLDELFGGVAPASAVQVFITITGQTEVVSDTVGVPALDLTGLPDNSSINIINQGDVYGHGGAGGDGESYVSNDTSGCQITSNPKATAGGDGGDAIVYDGTGVNLEIDNVNGRIFGGGGGGGGGRGCFSGLPCIGQAGGGGGGGSGGAATGGLTGAGGSGGTSTRNGSGDPAWQGSDGANGPTGPTGGGGAGGARATGLVCGGHEDGGDGGDFGAAGTQTTGGGAAGAAGKAIENNGTGSTSFLTGGVQGTDVKGTVE